ncbi:MAG: DUF4091 domain-containing protein [Clostridia bacterium]|nr:DUF4091 domain-containing protein [Clostridia bacterium]
MFIWTEYSTKQVFGNARPQRDSKNAITVDAPRGAYCAAQVIVRDIVPIELERIEVKCCTAVEAGKRRKGSGGDIKVRLFRQEYTVYNDRTAYPDRLSAVKAGKVKMKLTPHCAHGFWVDFYVPAEAAPGVYEYVLTLSGPFGSAEAKLTLKVHKATVLPAAESRFSHEYFYNLHLLPGAKIKRFTEEWWQLLGHYADVFRELRNNCIWVHINDLLLNGGSTAREDGKLDLRWETFDRYVQLFIDRGAASGFTVLSTIQSVEGKYISAIGPDGKTHTLDTPSEAAAAYIRELYTQLRAHLKEKGWLGIFRTHLEDEPHTTDVWLWAHAIVSEVCPEIVIGEPLDMIESARGTADKAAWMVPRVNVFQDDPELFRRFVDRGGELWLYSCCFPEEAWYLNKFVDLPFIRSRLMEWACIDVGAKGFLHWGFNFWGDGHSLYGYNADARFKGDGAIVYPNVRARKLDIGARFINTRDGLQDADLFMQLLGSGRPELIAAARKIAGSATHGSFINFSDDDEAFAKKQRALLALADKIY